MHGSSVIAIKMIDQFNTVTSHSVVYITALSTRESDCSTGDLRLVGGSSPLSGTVELCINNAWGTICDSEFSSQDAEVICRQIGELPNGEHRCLYSYILSIYSHEINKTIRI